MVGKHNVEELFHAVGKLDWTITFLENKNSNEYEVDDFFKLVASSREEFESVTLHKKSSSKMVDIPYFLCIKPTWFVREDALYVTFISGNKPSELERVVFWFDCFGCDQPKFEFIISPLVDDQPAVIDQDCDTELHTKDGAPVQSVMFALRSGSGGSRGGGIGH